MDFPYIKFDSQNLNFKKPFGAVACSTTLTFKIVISKDFCSDEIILHINNEINNRIQHNNISMNFFKEENDYNHYTCSIISSSIPCISFYYFEIKNTNTTLYYGNNKNNLGGIGEIYEASPIPYQLTVYSKEISTPAWFKHSIMYQIFVDRFFNGNEDGKISNPKPNSFIYGCWEDTPMYIKNPSTMDILRWDFFGGNLKGIIKKLDYLQELGVNLIYLNPIFEASSNHKYDTGNYLKIDPMFGDETIFKSLIEKAKERGINLILDGVFNHTGADSIYFNKYNSYNSVGAYQSKESSYYSWYNFDAFPNNYECWWGVKALPSVNEMDHSYINFIINDENSVIKHWMRAGIKGFRLDVADELPDDFIKSIKKTCKEIDNDAILIGEVWEDASNKISYGIRKKYFIEDELDSVTNYPFREAMLMYLRNEISSKTLCLKFLNLYENYPLENFYSSVNVIGTHDVERIYTMLKNHAKEDTSLAFIYLKIITLTQLTIPGVPLIYYGDEVGLEGLKDPYNRATYPWGKENKEILNWYKRIIKIRKDLVVLRTGDFQPFYFNEDVFGFIRDINNGHDIFNETQDNSIAIVIINRSSDKKYNISLTLPNTLFSEFLDLINDNTISANNNIISIEIMPLEASLFLGKQ